MGPTTAICLLDAPLRYVRILNITLKTMIQANIDESIFSVNRHISTIKRLKKDHKKPYSYLTHDTKFR